MPKAPDFTLPDQTGAMRSLQDFGGKWLVLYFYPQDDTPGCTTEACAFRDWQAQLQERGLAVVGISPDSVASHAKFAAKYHLNFPILADESHGALAAYGAWDPVWRYGAWGHVSRKTFLIGPDGEIAKEYPKVKPEGHVQQVLADFASLQEGAV